MRDPKRRRPRRGRRRALEFGAVPRPQARRRSAEAPPKLARSLPPAPARPGAALGAALFAGWIFVLAGGVVLVMRHSGAPGVAADPPPRWPDASAIPRAPGRATLIMLLHPRCPCSRASLRELERIAARAGDTVAAHVIFAGHEEDGPGRGDLRRLASAIPGVHVHADPRGDEARRFGAATSGQVIVYDAEGVAVFQGGITPARGHEGDNAGEQAILDLLLRGAPGPALTPVFGCGLTREQDAR